MQCLSQVWPLQNDGSVYKLALLLLCLLLDYSIVSIHDHIMVAGHGRWVFELEPATEEQSIWNLNRVRITGESDASGLHEEDNIYQFADKTHTVELVFVDSISEPRILQDVVDMSLDSYARRQHDVSYRFSGRVVLNMLKQKDSLGVAFERKIKCVYRIKM